MARKIIDEFTDKPISRQRKYQLRLKKSGICPHCHRIMRLGMADSKTHHSWDGMIQRCTNPNNRGWKNYGGRGITVCEEWRTFRNFLKDMGMPPPGTSLGRIDNNLGYFKGNCEWQTPAQQSINKRNNRFVIFGGVRMTIPEASKLSGIAAYTIRSRMIKGKTGDDLFSPVNHKLRVKEVKVKR